MAEPIQFPVTQQGNPRVLQYPRPLHSTRDHPSRPRNRPELPSEPIRYSIQGLRASREEWLIYQALLSAGFSPQDIQFQVGVLGGRNFRGGVVIDFVVATKPLATPIWVNGEYWHAGEQVAEDWLKKQRVAEDISIGLGPPIDFWGAELQDRDSALWAILDKIGRA